MTNESLGSAWYELGIRDSEFRTKVKGAEDILKATGAAGEKAFGDQLAGGVRKSAVAIEDVNRRGDELPIIITRAERRAKIMADALQMAAEQARATGDGVEKVAQASGRIDDARATELADSLGRADTKADQLDEAVRKVVSETNALRGKSPDELAQSFERAADSADEVFEAVRKIGSGDNLDTAKARKYAAALDEIGIEADQSVADLRELQASDPKFDTPRMREAAAQLDRVGTEAREGAAHLNSLKGVGADTHLERLAHEARDSADGLDKAGDASDGLMGKLKSVKGVLVALGLAVSAQQVLRFVGDSVEVFIAQERALKSVNMIFDESSDVIEDWGDRSATAAGLSRREVSVSAAIIGQSLKNMDFDVDESAETVVRLQQRAADLAATFGGETSDAIDAIGSLLRGERDPIERFGVTIKQTDVNARILALGLDTSTAAGKRHAEMVATLDLFWDQSADAAGRFGDSVGDIGVRLDQAEARIENAKAQVGEFTSELIINGLEIVDATVRTQRAVEITFDFIAMRFGDQGDKLHALAERWGTDFDTMSLMAAEWQVRTGGSVEEAMAHLNSKVGEGLAKLVTETETTWTFVAGIPTASLEAKYQSIRDAAYQSTVEYAKGLIAGQDLPQTAFDAAMQMMEDEMTAAEESAHLHGQLVTLEHALGIASAEGKVATVNAINAAMAVITNRLSTLPGQANLWGYNSALGLAHGLDRGYGVVRTSAGNIAGAVRGQIGINSEPEDPTSPLRGNTKWGGNLVRTYIDDMLDELGSSRADLQAVADAFVLPGAGAGRAASMFDAAGSASGGSRALSLGGITLHLHGFDGSHGSIEEVSRKLTESIQLRMAGFLDAQ